MVEGFGLTYLFVIGVQGSAGVFFRMGVNGEVDDKERIFVTYFG